MSTGWALLASLLLLAGNAGFVASEFALVAAKRHRLERAAASGSRSAGAALAGARQLSLVLAGTQLGITACTLGLGAVAKPAVADGLERLLRFPGLPAAAADLVAFVLAVMIVAFLHVVVAEMMPKSWAISHPEESALLLARPFRIFARMVRPLLEALNLLANLCLRLIRVQPADRVAAPPGSSELRVLLDTSRDQGTLDDEYHRLLAAMLAIQHTTVSQVMTPADQVILISAAAEAREVERLSGSSGRSRLVVPAADHRSWLGIVHVRDAVRATTRGDRVLVADLMTDPLAIPAATSVAEAVRTMRQTRTQLAVVTDRTEAPCGVVALEDLLEELIGEFDDETDLVPRASGRGLKPLRRSEVPAPGLDAAP